MVQAETLMRQAGYTATEWLNQAKEAVSDMSISDEAKAQIIAAFIRAAAQDQHTMTIRSLAEEGLLQGVKID
ncbi:MAG: hypothetical protein COB00_00365 [Alcanivorax sp.]|nr:MAG: hypothetical protein COB00_05195 [Alcanivorax sp.]PHS72844.1 MAG: hypothetical protein COB00_00365 [Alcanivorax sp.]|tara:strand:- start:7035 stop:7250 length:216 start_codon:yes stop_codon:yes gene_type:complete